MVKAGEGGVVRKMRLVGNEFNGREEETCGRNEQRI